MTTTRTALSLLALFALISSGCSSSGSPAPAAAATDAGADAAPAPDDFQDTLPQPATMDNASTAPNTVEVSITASVAKLALAPGKAASRAYAYNGSVPGPTLVATEGDHVIVHFTNKLPESTTVHWHGLHVPANQDGNPMDAVAPGASRDYVFDLPEGSAGTYWYHPHPDGKTAEQVYMGLFGAIIVRAKNDPVPQGILDELLVLNDNRFDSNGAISADTMDDQMNGRMGDVLFVNGTVMPTMTIRPGETRRLRILNASAARYYLLSVPNHQLTQIGTSGLFGPPQTQNQILLAPAERIEVLLQATADPGSTTTLRALSYDRGIMTMDGSPAPSKQADLMAIAYTSDAPMTSPDVPNTLRDVAPIDTTGVTTRSFVLSEQMMSYMINGQSYDPMRVDTHAKLGATEVWTVTNTASMDHPFHLHGFQFQVLARNGKKEPVVAWYDTVNVPKNNGSVKLAVTFADFAGMRMYHCHILEHEDLGMMGMLDVE
jgi:bilirubin oxidase